MDWDYELTEKDYQRALANGIERDRARERVYNLGWDKERAVTEPINKKVDRSHWIRVAADHGITRSAFNTRLQRGWSEEKAATTPKVTYESFLEKGRETQRRFPVEYLKKAVSNGIPEQSFRRRVRAGWSLEKAATTPIDTKKIAKELITK